MNDDIIDTLNDLIETSKDGEYGFRGSAEYAKSAQLKQMFSARAQECQQAAVQLQALVEKMGGSAEDGGTFGGAAQRGWLTVKGSLTGHTDLDILEEVESAEDAALESYRMALGTSLPPEAQALVESQYEGVKRNHAQVRMLRDQARVANV
jgi:uncharacterized protein (TIGR02284 family)